MIEALFAAVVRARRRGATAAFDRRRLAAPVVSVGNLRLGGRGKTPVVGEIVRLLLARGERPAILSRGYGRAHREDGVTVVSDGARILADVARGGDEPLMLARQCPGAIVCVSDDRALAGCLAETRLGATVHVLDDGFQHHRLHRDIDVVLVGGADLGDRVLPFGRLREPLDTLGGLGPGDALVVDGPDAVDGVRLAPQAFQGRLERLVTRPASLVPEARVVAVAGIAGPVRFFDAAESVGLRLVERMAFRDHHHFGAADIRAIAAAATRTGAVAIVTTAKDATRLPPDGWPAPLVVLPLSARVEPAEAFEAWLIERLRAVRGVAVGGNG